MDAYGTLLGQVLFPTWERWRGRGTQGLEAYLARTQWASVDELTAIQTGGLRRLADHATRNTAHYRAAFAEAGVALSDVTSPEALRRLPVLDRTTARQSIAARTSTAGPTAVVNKQTSGTTGEPMMISYCQESREWRDADRWRGYGWAGYQMGHKALHYWAVLARGLPTRRGRAKLQLDRWLKRDLYLDSTPRADADLAKVVTALRSFGPDVMVAYTQGAGELARYVTRTGARTWAPFPVLCGAERVWSHDRLAIEQAFGPVFETYGSREFMLVGAECEAHDGLHVSMEKLIVELLVRDADGRWRDAQPGETGEIVITDLHNLAVPMIRYQTGDQAVARAHTSCSCGRTLARIGPIDGRTTETLRDGRGAPVSGLLFSILFVSIAPHTDQFQAVQRAADGTLTLRVVPSGGARAWAPEAEALTREFVGKYLPGIRFVLEIVDTIPLTSAGKRRLVVVEP